MACSGFTCVKIVGGMKYPPLAATAAGEWGLPGEFGFAFAGLDQAEDFLDGVGVDHGADDGAWERRVSDRCGGGGFKEALDELVVDVGEDDEPRERGALLAGEAKGACEGGGDGFVEVGIVVDDERVFAAHLADDFLRGWPDRAECGRRLPRFWCRRRGSR